MDVLMFDGCFGKTGGGRKKTRKKTTKKGKKRGRASERDATAAGSQGQCPFLGASPMFCTVLSDLATTHPVSQVDLEFAGALSVARWRGRCHGAFAGQQGAGAQTFAGNTRVAGRDVEGLRGLWSRGCYWSLERKRDMLGGMVQTYEKEFQSRVSKELPEVVAVRGVQVLARRLRSAAEALHARLEPGHPRNKAAFFTILHGDMKGANIALRPPDSQCGESDSGPGVAVMDFQWAGGGLGCRDLAYFMISAVAPAALERHDELLRAYYQTRKMHTRKGAPFMKYAAFVECYEAAFCDFMRWLAGYGLWGGPAEEWCLQKAHSLLARIDGGAVGTCDQYRACAWLS